MPGVLALTNSVAPDNDRFMFRSDQKHITRDTRIVQSLKDKRYKACLLIEYLNAVLRVCNPSEYIYTF